MLDDTPKVNYTILDDLASSRDDSLSGSTSDHGGGGGGVRRSKTPPPVFTGNNTSPSQSLSRPQQRHSKFSRIVESERLSGMSGPGMKKKKTLKRRYSCSDLGACAYRRVVRTNYHLSRSLSRLCCPANNGSGSIGINDGVHPLSTNDGGSAAAVGDSNSHQYLNLFDLETTPPSHRCSSNISSVPVPALERRLSELCTECKNACRRTGNEVRPVMLAGICRRCAKVLSVGLERKPNTSDGKRFTSPGVGAKTYNSSYHTGSLSAGGTPRMASHSARSSYSTGPVAATSCLTETGHQSAGSSRTGSLRSLNKPLEYVNLSRFDGITTNSIDRRLYPSSSKAGIVSSHNMVGAAAVPETPGRGGGGSRMSLASLSHIEHGRSSPGKGGIARSESGRSGSNKACPSYSHSSKGGFASTQPDVMGRRYGTDASSGVSKPVDGNYDVPPSARSTSFPIRSPVYLNVGPVVTSTTVDAATAANLSSDGSSKRSATSQMTFETAAVMEYSSGGSYCDLSISSTPMMSSDRPTISASSNYDVPLAVRRPRGSGGSTSDLPELSTATDSSVSAALKEIDYIPMDDNAIFCEVQLPPKKDTRQSIAQCRPTMTYASDSTEYLKMADGGRAMIGDPNGKALKCRQGIMADQVDAEYIDMECNGIRRDKITNSKSIIARTKAEYLDMSQKLLTNSRSSGIIIPRTTLPDGRDCTGYLDMTIAPSGGAKVFVRSFSERGSFTGDSPMMRTSKSLDVDLCVAAGPDVVSDRSTDVSAAAGEDSSPYLRMDLPPPTAKRNTSVYIDMNTSASHRQAECTAQKPFKDLLPHTSGNSNSFHGVLNEKSRTFVRAFTGSSVPTSSEGCLPAASDRRDAMANVGCDKRKSGILNRLIRKSASTKEKKLSKFRSGSVSNPQIQAAATDFNSRSLLSQQHLSSSLEKLGPPPPVPRVQSAGASLQSKLHNLTSATTVRKKGTNQKYDPPKGGGSAANPIKFDVGLAGDVEPLSSENVSATDASGSVTSSPKISEKCPIGSDRPLKLLVSIYEDDSEQPPPLPEKLSRIQSIVNPATKEQATSLSSLAMPLSSLATSRSPTLANRVSASTVMAAGNRKPAATIDQLSSLRPVGTKKVDPPVDIRIALSEVNVDDSDQCMVMLPQGGGRKATDLETPKAEDVRNQNAGDPANDDEIKLRGCGGLETPARSKQRPKSGGATVRSKKPSLTVNILKDDFEPAASTGGNQLCEGEKVCSSCNMNILSWDLMSLNIM